MNSTQSLAPTASSDLDPYEAKYMGGGDAILFRSKARNDWRVAAFIGSSAIFLIVWSALHANLPLGLIGAALVVLIWLFMGFMRVKVSTSDVDVHYGIFGPRIPISSIESVEPVEHLRRSFLWWGMSPTRHGEWVYSVAGDQGRAVKIVWRNARGKRRVHIIGCARNVEFAAAIRQARSLAATPQSTALPRGET